MHDDIRNRSILTLRMYSVVFRANNKVAGIKYISRLYEYEGFPVTILLLFCLHKRYIFDTSARGSTAELICSTKHRCYVFGLVTEFI